MCRGMSDSTYLSRVSARIVRMFELYLSKIDAEDPQFRQFIADYAANKDVKNPETIPYSQLYKLVRSGIQEYIKQTSVGQKNDQV